MKGKGEGMEGGFVGVYNYEVMLCVEMLRVGQLD